MPSVGDYFFALACSRYYAAQKRSMRDSWTASSFTPIDTFWRDVAGIFGGVPLIVLAYIVVSAAKAAPRASTNTSTSNTWRFWWFLVGRAVVTVVVYEIHCLAGKKSSVSGCL